MTHDSATHRWWQNPNIQSALITGFLGLLGTAITIYATRPPAPAPVPTPPNSFTNVDSHAQNNSATNPSDAFATGSSQSLAQPAVNLCLNFAEYQKQVATPAATAEEQGEKGKYLNSFTGRTVVWEGYFDTLTIHREPPGSSYLTVSLVERPGKVTQTMFKQPALIRMPITELATAGSLQPGEPITVSGKFDSYSVVATVVTDGQFLARSEKLARGQSGDLQR